MLSLFTGILSEESNSEIMFSVPNNDLTLESMYFVDPVIGIDKISYEDDEFFIQKGNNRTLRMNGNLSTFETTGTV